MALFRKFFYRKPPDGLLEISERVYVFDCCFTTDVLEEDEYKVYIGGIVAQLRDHFPDASFVVFNFREGDTQSQISSILSDYDMTVMDYPRQFEGCPLLTMEMVHHFLRSSESWLSLGQQNLLLMHCERGGWPVLAFMLAALLVYRKQYAGEQRTLDMIYKQAPRELLHLLSPLNPLPSQLRYLHYISRRNVGLEWPPLDRALTLDCIILRLIPDFDGAGGCRPIFRIYGQDPFIASDRSPKVLFSTPKKSKLVRFYKQEDCELVKVDIHCHIQGDVVLECISLDEDLEREEMMFRVMFNTAFIRSNILMLDRDAIDILWDAKDRFPKDFRVEVLLSEMDAANSITTLELPSSEEKEGLPIEAFAKVQEMFNNLDWLELKADAATKVLQQIASSKSLQENLDAVSPQKFEYDIMPKKSSSDLLHEKDHSGETNDRNKKSLPSKSLQENLDAVSPQKFEYDIMPKKSSSDLLHEKDQSGETNDKHKKSLPSSPKKQPVPLSKSSDSNTRNENVELHGLQIPTQQPSQIKIISQRIPASRSTPAFSSNSLPGSHAAVSRYHSAPSALGIMALLHDHAAFDGSEVTHTTKLSPLVSTSSASGSNISSESSQHLLSAPVLTSSACYTKETSIAPAPIPSPPPPAAADAKTHAGRTVIPPPAPESPSRTSKSSIPEVSQSPAQKLSASAPHTFTTSLPSHHGTSTRANDKLTSILPSPCPPFKGTSLTPVSAGLEKPTSALVTDQVFSSNVASKSVSNPPPPPLIASLRPITNLLPLRKAADTAAVPRPPPPPCPGPGHAVVTLASPPPSPPHISPKHSGGITTKLSLPPAPCPPVPPSPKSSLPPAPPHLPPIPKLSSLPPAPPPVSSSPESSSLPPAPLPVPPIPKSSSLPPTPPPVPPSPKSSSLPPAPPPVPPIPKSSSPPPAPPPVPPSSRSSPLPPAPPPVPLSPRSSPLPPAPPPAPRSPKSSLPPAPPPPAPPSSLKTLTAPNSSGGKGSNCEVIPPPPPGGMSAPSLGGKGRVLARAPNSRMAQSSSRKANLKPLHWVKVTRAVQGSLWAESHSDEFSKAPEFDMSELESLFSAAVPNSDRRGSGSKSSGRSMGSKSDKVHLIDLRRANNCEIMLTKVKMPLNDLMSSVLALDDSILDVDQVDNLIKFCPTKEEMDLLKAFNGDKDNLGKCEQYFLELMKVPRVESKLRVFSFKIQFRSQVAELKGNLNVVNSAAGEIRSSVKLKRIMQTILSLGNALNQGTARGSAVGFRLDSLLKLTDTRARNNKMTLMNYLCKVLAEKLPELLDFPKDLVSLEVAAKMQLKSLAEEMQAINKGLEKVELELTASENDGPVSETFCKTLKEFLAVAEGEVRALTSLYSNVGRNADALALYFGEDPARCPFEQVVSTLLNFVRMFVRAHEENCKQLELEKKKAQKESENEKAKIHNPKKEPQNIPSPTDSDNAK